ncbi:MAG: GatB/YqeY domain-containing protein [Acidobacteriota bacterium]|jgi:uncharacterized protein YqeY
MSTPRERIEIDVQTALKAQEKLELSTLRMLLNAIKNEQIRIGAEVDEASFVNLVRRAIKQRRDSIEQYRQGGREDLADKETREAEILQRYLPPQVDEEEIRSAIRELIDREGLTGPQSLGTVMQAMMKRFSGMADGATINRIARDILAEEP